MFTILRPDIKFTNIPAHRQHYISQVLKDFKKTYEITSIPVNCVELIKKMEQAGPFKIRCRATTHLPPGMLARTFYVRQGGLHLVSINQNQIACGQRPKYPFMYSLDRMLNFTIAHEIGHIALNHFELEDRCKDKETVIIEDLEANEFAGRLLMPAEELLACRDMTKAQVAELFMVTELALLKRVTLLFHYKLFPKEFPFCHLCGTLKFSPDDQHCRVCGVPLYASEQPRIYMQYANWHHPNNTNRPSYCPRTIADDHSGLHATGNVSGFYLYNAHLNQICRVEIVADSSYKYCRKCEPSGIYTFDITLDGWSLWDEHLKIEGIDLNNPAPIRSTLAIDDNHWNSFLQRLVHDKQDLLADAFQGSHSKVCGRTFMIFLNEEGFRDKFNKSEYLELLLTYLQDYLETMLNSGSCQCVALPSTISISEKIIDLFKQI